MEKRIRDLESKLDKIIAMQELILSKLEESIIIPTNRNAAKKELNRSKKKSEFQHQIRQKLLQSMTLKPHKRRLQEKYNLLVPPSENRVLEYLKTQDPKVFDGLKRNN